MKLPWDVTCMYQLSKTVIYLNSSKCICQGSKVGRGSNFDILLLFGNFLKNSLLTVFFLSIKLS